MKNMTIHFLKIYFSDLKDHFISLVPKIKFDMEIAVCILHPEKLKIQEGGRNFNEMEN